MKYLPLLFLLGLSALASGQQMPHGTLRVSDNGRFLVHADGTPFFWQADTAWELFHRCNRKEADFYLEKRKEQGFNVIQAVALAEIDGLHTPNPYGERPLVNDDPTKPNPKYFEHVDYIIDRAAGLGIYIALLPTWGDKLFANRWGVGPEVFNPENARAYGKWIGARYKDRENIIWVLGGDRNPRAETEDVKVWQEMAAGIAEACGGFDKALMTFHPQPAEPGGSSNWFHQDEWLDFNMHQTGHCPDKATYELIWHDYQLSPVKPVLDGEPLYEDHPNCFNAKELGHSVPEDIRRIMYWNVFAGAFGQTYGCHDIWQMYTNERQPINAPLRPWQKALDLPMAWQVQHLQHLMLSRPFLSRIPDQGMIVGPQLEGNDHVIATRDESGSYAMIYFPTGKSATVDLNKLSGTKYRAWWFDPRTGNAYSTGKFRNAGRQLFAPPTAGKGHDWVLVLDDAKRDFPVPGEVME